MSSRKKPVSTEKNQNRYFDKNYKNSVKRNVIPAVSAAFPERY